MGQLLSKFCSESCVEDSDSEISPNFSVAIAKSQSADPDSSAKFIPPPNWAKAQEFQPANLCLHAMNGTCRFGPNCKSIHGLLCDLCNLFVLHPYDETQRQNHKKDCIERHEACMEYSFKVAATIELKKECGICLEIIKKHEFSKRHFGIMSDCNHSFCYVCIKGWRNSKDFPANVNLGCPVCRVVSKSVAPSPIWVENETEKETLIQDYYKLLSVRPCKAFNRGRGTCKYGEFCFHSHSVA